MRIKEFGNKKQLNEVAPLLALGAGLARVGSAAIRGVSAVGGALAKSAVASAVVGGSNTDKRDTTDYVKMGADIARATEDMDPKGPEVTIGDYTTKYFYMCGSAIETAEKHADKPGMEKLIRLLDMMYKLERTVMDAGESSDEAKEFAQTLHIQIMQTARDIGIDDEVAEYQNMHLDSIIKGDPKPGFGRVDIDEQEEITLDEDQDFHEEFGILGYSIDENDMFEAEYRGRKVKLNKPMQGDVKKFKVYVKNKKGNVIKVNFGHGGTSAKGKTMRIRKSNPKARKSFRARHNCDNPGPKTKARYWSCRKW